MRKTVWGGGNGNGRKWTLRGGENEKDSAKRGNENDRTRNVSLTLTTLIISRDLALLLLKNGFG
jgi:hypothetical protein